MPFQEQAAELVGPMRRCRAVVLQSGGRLLLVLVLAGAGRAWPDQLQPANTQSLIEQKLVLASRLIERLPSPRRDELRDTLEGLQTRVLLGEQAGLVEDADRLLSEVSSAYRRRADRQEESQARYRERYLERHQELLAFRDAYQAVSAETGSQAAEVLDAEDLQSRVSRAEQLAAQGQYTEAYAMLDGAYHQLVQALKQLRDRQTVEYPLVFASLAEEYDYETRRYRSQRMVLDMWLAQSPPDEERARAMSARISAAQELQRQAEVWAGRQQYVEALAAAEAAVEELTKAMRMAGFYF